MRNIFKFLIAIFTFSLILGFYVWRIEPRWVEWNHLDMPTSNLPASLVDKKLVQISDIHIGETVDEEYIIEQFKRISKINPDILVYTGDFISLVNVDQAPFDQLRRILKQSPKGILGTVAILGNHDYGILARNSKRADSLVHILESHGITVLSNDSVSVDGLNIIGIDDYWGTNFYPEKALDLYRKEKPNLIFVPTPDVCDLDVWRGYDGWILSGHTHGGQVRFPFQKAKIIPVDNKNYDQGLKHLSNGRTLYINKGLGHSMRVRWNVRPEITVFTLKRKDRK